MKCPDIETLQNQSEKLNTWLEEFVFINHMKIIHNAENRSKNLDHSNCVFH